MAWAKVEPHGQQQWVAGVGIGVLDVVADHGGRGGVGEWDGGDKGLRGHRRANRSVKQLRRGILSPR